MKVTTEEQLSAPAPGLSLRDRVVLALPRVGIREEERPGLGERFRTAVLKPAVAEAVDGADAGRGNQKQPTVDELRAEVKSADDKERAIGLIAAPVAAAIAFMVTASLIANDPAQHLASGALNPKYVSVSLYHDVNLVLLALSVVMLGCAWFRKRLFLGIALALYGLAIFNLHFWGFGVPFLMAGAWYLVRAYRAQRALREATGELATAGAGPAPSKRYTPPAAARRQG
jgi:hypothetical protein